MKRTLRFSCAILLLFLTAFAVRMTLSHWFFFPDQNPYCGFPQDSECIARQADLFMKVDYPESKDLGKSFLTLLSAVLVASITFSEKIVDVHNASTLAVSTMMVCWLLLFVSIVTCGVGLAFVVTAQSICVYSPDLDYRSVEMRGAFMFLAAGVTFVFSLVSLIVAGIASLVERRRLAAIAATA
ncbi:hypothetical protein CBA19CS22_34810 [Caballeronia novacaledonica]|uniref:Uncharacterized protein n=1 Tax=Caballeronia novacaledonica TaxID=1544861 RepID=A0ACB5R3Q8_9BURK|nr:hypothetical protein CBA19CS22_34810 [Caballeronia novacaledonica]